MFNRSYTDYSWFYKRKLRCVLIGGGQDIFNDAVSGA